MGEVQQRQQIYTACLSPRQRHNQTLRMDSSRLIQDVKNFKSNVRRNVGGHSLRRKLVCVCHEVYDNHYDYENDRSNASQYNS
jgi:hypothetical protein